MAASIAQLGNVPAKNKQATQAVLDAAKRAGWTVQQVWGVGAGDHADGYASDFMVYSNRAMGDWIADYVWRNRAALGVRWIIWRQRIISTTMPRNAYGPGNQWNPMPDRGDTTQNHMDHVHVKWNTAPVGALLSAPVNTIPTPTLPVPTIPAPVPEEDEVTPEDIDKIALAVWGYKNAEVNGKRDTYRLLTDTLTKADGFTLRNDLAWQNRTFLAQFGALTGAIAKLSEGQALTADQIIEASRQGASQALATLDAEVTLKPAADDKS
jgi:hypothetical protein